MAEAAATAAASAVGVSVFKAASNLEARWRGVLKRGCGYKLLIKIS
jgi:hypothetical protein